MPQLMQRSFSILVTASPTQSQGHLSAIRFIDAAVKLGHVVDSVFFYQEATAVANGLVIKPDDELQLTQKWIDLAKSNRFELQVCVAASNRRGIISPEEAAQNGLNQHNLNSEFTVTGLGQLAVMLASSAKSGHQHVQFK